MRTKITLPVNHLLRFLCDDPKNLVRPENETFSHSFKVFCATPALIFRQRLVDGMREQQQNCVHVSEEE